MLLRIALTTALVAGLSSSVLARPNTTQMTCQQARDLVTRSGKINLDTGPRTFEQFVANRSYCSPTQVVRKSFAPTKDGQCFVGYYCTDQRRNRSR